MKPTRIDRGADMRRKELAKIHIAKKQLGLDRDTYVSILRRIGDVDTSADLDGNGRRRLIEELHRLGARPAQKAANKARLDEIMAEAPKSVREDNRAMVDKVTALLIDADRTWAYAHALATRMFRTTRVEWLPPPSLHKLIAALEMDRRRRAKRDAIGESDGRH